MLSLLGSLLGFTTSFIPKALDYFQDKQDKAHELRLIVAQVEAQTKLEGVRLQAVHVEAGIREIESVHKEQALTVRKGSKWLANLSGSVRPVVTYLFVAEFLIINWAIATVLITEKGLTVATLQAVLDDRFVTLLATMLAFWFGSRHVEKGRTQ